MTYCYGLRAARVCNYVPELIISADIYQALEELNQLCWCNGKKKLSAIWSISGCDILSALGKKTKSNQSPNNILCCFTICVDNWSVQSCCEVKQNTAMTKMKIEIKQYDL